MSFKRHLPSEVSLDGKIAGRRTKGKRFGVGIRAFLGDLSLAVGHAEPHARDAGMFLDAVRQGLRMRGNPELSVFRGAND